MLCPAARASSILPSKTAETGYMSRRLMKSLEDLSARYDGTVRDSGGGVVQVKFGDDGLDPVDMEGSGGKPVDFERAFMHAANVTWDNWEKGLTAMEIERVLSEELEDQRKKLIRKRADGTRLGYYDTSDAGVDQLESHRAFLAEIEDFINTRTKEIVSNQKRLPGSEEKIFKLTRSALDLFLALCLRKFEKSKVEAGHAVGAVGAQSIGEPGTQMTLKTFHFAGVAGMSITQGVPRIKEIINASKSISTPIIACGLDSPYEAIAARMAKAGIQKTYLRDIAAYVEDCWAVDACYINMRVDWQQVERLGLRIGLGDVATAIQETKGMKTLGIVVTPYGRSHIRIDVDPAGESGKGGKKKGPKKAVERGNEMVFETLQALKRRLPSVVIRGYPEAQRAVMQKDDKPDHTGKEPISVMVEGYGLKQCMTTPGVDGTRTKTNSVMEMKAVLGIEAARSSIIEEVSKVMASMDIDPRHMQLLADVMTYKGDVLGITRFGLAKMRDSVLQLASFEKTPDHLFEAAVQMKRDEIRGVSENIIMGQSVGLGTGAMRVFRPLGVEGMDAGGGSRPDVGGVTVEWRKGARDRKERLKALRSELAGTKPEGGLPGFVPPWE